MEREGPWPCLQNPAILYQSSQSPSYFFKIPFNIILNSTPKDETLS